MKLDWRRALLWIPWWIFYGYGVAVTVRDAAVTGSPPLWIVYGIYGLGTGWMAWYIIGCDWIDNDGKTLAFMVITWPFVVATWCMGSNWRPRTRTQSAPEFPIARVVKWRSNDSDCLICGPMNSCDARLHG